MEAVTGVGAGAGIWASKTVSKFLYKSSLEYLEIFVTARGAMATKSFVSKGLAGYLDNLSPNSKDGEESWRVTEGAMEGVTEGVVEERSRRRCPRPQTKIILMQTFF